MSDPAACMSCGSVEPLGAFLASGGSLPREGRYRFCEACRNYHAEHGARLVPIESAARGAAELYQWGRPAGFCLSGLHRRPRGMKPRRRRRSIEAVIEADRKRLARLRAARLERD